MAISSGSRLEQNEPSNAVPSGLLGSLEDPAMSSRESPGWRSRRRRARNQVAREKAQDTRFVLGADELAQALMPAARDDPQRLGFAGALVERSRLQNRNSLVGVAVDQQQCPRADALDVAHRAVR